MSTIRLQGDAFVYRVLFADEQPARRPAIGHFEEAMIAAASFAVACLFVFGVLRIVR